MKPFRFGIIGDYQSGKSLFINCLLQRSIATVGEGIPTTHTIVNYRYGENEYVEYIDEKRKHHRISIDELRKLDTATSIGVIDIYLTIDLLKNCTLTDMPGFGANAEDNEIAQKVLPDIDLAILIVWSDKALGETSDLFRRLKSLKAHRIPYYFVLNCTKIERWRCDDEGNMAIAQKDFNMLSFYPPSRYPLEPNGINVLNLMWYWYSICNVEDELVNRKKYKSAFEDYGINQSLKKQLAEVSQFASINKLFSMEYRDFLELKRSFREDIKSLKNELCPIGTIQTFAFNTVPEGWLVCDGGLLSINLFPELYSVIGTLFGGNGESNFALPDLRGRFVRGWNADGENDPERIFGSTQEDTMQEHQHHFDSTALTISEGGNHNHPLWCQEHNTLYGVSGLFASSYKAKRMFPHTNYALENTDLGTYAGVHNHDLTMSKNPILNPQSMTSEKIRVSSENRPKNIALLFCIRCK